MAEHRDPSETYLPIQGTDSLQVSRDGNTLRVKLTDLHTPERNFTAHATRCSCLGASSSGFQLAYAQVVHPRRITSVVVIDVDRKHLATFLDSCREGFLTSLSRQSQDEPDPPELTDSEMTQVDPSRIWVAKATLARAAVSSNGAQIEWYEIPPVGLAAFARRRTIQEPTPLISIFLTAACLRGSINAIERSLAGTGSRSQPERGEGGAP